MHPAALAKIVRAYGLEVRCILPSQKGYRNSSFPLQQVSGPMLNFILYKDEPGILARIIRANKIADFMASAGMPARRTFDSRIICLKSSGGVRYGSLYEYLPGKTIPWEAYTHRHLKLLGKTMSDLHAVLAKMPDSQLLSVTDEYLAILSRMQSYFADSQIAAALAKKLHLRTGASTLPAFFVVLGLMAQLPNQQPLHMDFVRGNILFQGSDDTLAISGILDFEKTAHGHPLFDVARTLAFLLVDCKYKTPQEIQNSFLRSGYARRGKSPLRVVTLNTRDQYITALESLTNLFLFYDFYKFLRHNPYESLPQNEHFVRTRDILLQKGLLTALPY